MKVDKSTLEKVAHLARVEVPKEMEKQVIADLEKILTWVEKLNEVNTKDVEALTHMSFERNALREDDPKNTLTRSQGLANAPEHDKEYFKVPKVLDT
ncbi:MAG: Asp-tRNA(Asn)/Glu-tRNA(Gln) amidotransferase subunit GatC, partial [Bacteroidota bacterium]